MTSSYTCLQDSFIVQAYDADSYTLKVVWTKKFWSVENGMLTQRLEDHNAYHQEFSL